MDIKYIISFVRDKMCVKRSSYSDGEYEAISLIDSMSDELLFKAILAKNDIAREMKKEFPNRGVILARLVAIENYIGQSNQPSVMAIFTSLIDI